MNNSAVGHNFNVNQSAVGYIQKRKMKFVDLYMRHSRKCYSTVIVCDEAMEMVEKWIHLWIHEMMTA